MADFLLDVENCRSGVGCFSRKRLQYASIMKAYTNMP